MLRERDIEDLDHLNELSTMDAQTIMKLPTNHVIILAKNDLGTYQSVPSGQLVPFGFIIPRIVPLLPKSVLDKYREGLLIGSACEAGELYQALLRGAPDAEIARLVNFYDYLEIQP